MSIAFVLASAALAFQSGGTPAAEAPAPGQARAVEAGEELVCKKTALAGSKFKKRLCATAEEWERLARHAEETTQELQRTRASKKGG